MKLLLHACCGPCSLEPVRLLQEAGHDITIAYMNSNIHPQEEYSHRADTLRAWANQQNIVVVEGIYSPDAWEKAVEPSASEPDAEHKNRCRACYRLRFNEAALWASEHGFDGICTTLSVSPYQFTETIGEELTRAGEAYGLAVVFEDFRPFYAEATKRSKELTMYRQNYCGCRFSRAEAAAEREQRKLARTAAKEAKRALRAPDQETLDQAKAAKQAKRDAHAKKQAAKQSALKAFREQTKE